MRLTLIGRAYCHLCDDMRSQLAALLAGVAHDGGAPVEVVEVDVDADATLEARWGDKVPVLLCDDAEVCHYLLDSAAVRRALAGVAAGDLASRVKIG